MIVLIFVIFVRLLTSSTSTTIQKSSLEGCFNYRGKLILQ